MVKNHQKKNHFVPKITNIMTFQSKIQKKNWSCFVFLGLFTWNHPYTTVVESPLTSLGNKLISVWGESVLSRCKIIIPNIPGMMR